MFLTPLQKPGFTVKHAFSSVIDGNMSFKWGDKATVIHNRQSFLRKHKLRPEVTVSSAIEGDLQPRLVTTVHEGAGITNTHQPIPGHALFTTKPNLPLLLLTADCIPLIVYATEKPVIAVIHVSAKTLDNGILKTTIQGITEHTKVESKNLSVIFGPHIKVESYRHATPPYLKHDCWQEAVTPHGIHAVSVDLTKAAMLQLVGLGIEAPNITVHPSDTNTDNTFFSHYRSHRTHEPEGRFATVAWIEEAKLNHV
jgi:copper oxidase (laccase) domain-containing protein